MAKRKTPDSKPTKVAKKTVKKATPAKIKVQSLNLRSFLTGYFDDKKLTLGDALDDITELQQELTTLTQKHGRKVKVDQLDLN